MAIRRTTVHTASGKVYQIPLQYEPEPRPCDHHWEWINDHTIRCLRCNEVKK